MKINWTKSERRCFEDAHVPSGRISRALAPLLWDPSPQPHQDSVSRPVLSTHPANPKKLKHAQQKLCAVFQHTAHKASSQPCMNC